MSYKLNGESMKIIDFIKKNKSFLLTILLLLAFRWSFADQYRVPSGSMEPNIHIGDHIGVNKMAYDLKLPFSNELALPLHEPERGDVIVFIWPGDHSTLFVKRLIGLPGDHVEIHDGFIAINGKKVAGSENALVDFKNLDHDFQYKETLGRHQFVVQRKASGMKLESFDFIVPPNSYFFMGDNRDNSADSRVWGFVQRDAMKGKALQVLWNIRFDQLLPQMDFSRVLTKID